MSSSSSKSYGSSFNWNWPRPDIENYNHDLEAELVIFRTAANPGRRYYRCPIWKVWYGTIIKKMFHYRYEM